MPTNLPPEYFDAEERYKAASTPEERIRLLEDLISTVPKHKGTDKLRADLRKRLSKLKESSSSPKGGTRHVSAYYVEKVGAAQVPVIGAANVGKSALVTALTNATPEVAPFPHTTWSVTPGMMMVDHAPIQLVDTPPLVEEYVEPALMDLIRRADLLLLLLDLQADPLGQLEQTTAILAEHRIVPLHQKADVEAERHAFYVPMLLVVNKYDGQRYDEHLEILCELLGDKWPLIPVSAATGRNLEQLQKAVFDHLHLMRIYSQPPGREADLTKPFVLPLGSTVEEFAAQVHHDFYEQLKSARIWGSGQFDGQMVGRDHVLHEGDIVELRI